MIDPAATQGMEQLLLRQVTTELVKAALPESLGPAAGANADLFASVLADAVATRHGVATGHRERTGS